MSFVRGAWINSFIIWLIGAGVLKQKGFFGLKPQDFKNGTAFEPRMEKNIYLNGVLCR